MSISIVIPNYNRAEALQLTLEALNRQTYPADKFEVIVVDQASTDGSRGLVKDFPSVFRLVLVEQDHKYGPSIARNSGVEASEGSLIIFLDSDIIADPGLVEAHHHLHNSQNEPGLACGRVLPYSQAYQTYLERAVNPESGLDRPQGLEEIPFYWVFSNHLSSRKELLNHLGGFDPSLSAFEDIELAYRASTNHIKIRNCFHAIGFHNHPRTLKERCTQAREYKRYLPRLYLKYPEMRGRIPDMRPFEEIRIWSDPINLTIGKNLARFYSLLPVRRLFYQTCQILEAFPVSTRALKFFYYRLIQGYGYLGFSEGRKAL